MASSTHKGWRLDDDNSRLNMVYNGTNVAYINADGVVSTGLALTGNSTVTQQTSKSTAVTINSVCGQITTNNESLSTNAEVVFRVNNSLVDPNDVIVVNHGSVGTAGAYIVTVEGVGDGFFDVLVENASTGNLGEALVVNFAVIKCL